MSRVQAVTLPIERAATGAGIPSDRLLRQWVRAACAMAAIREPALGIRLVGLGEAAALNTQYRNKAYATNVLSFPCDTRLPDKAAWLGDIVVCAPVVRREATEQGRPLRAHWAHMIVHGVLHLLGHDHIKPREAARMEALEARILHRLGYGNPYNS